MHDASQSSDPIPDRGVLGDPPGEEEEWPSYLQERLGWLVRLRWIAIASIGATIAVAHLVELLESMAPLYAVAAAMVAYNIVFRRWAGAAAGSVSARSLERVAMAQMLADIAALTVLVRFAGGMTNPFVMFFCFHAAIGAMLLPRKRAIQLGLAACLFHGGITLGELAGALEPHPLLIRSGIGAGVRTEAPIPPAWALGYLLAFALMIFGTIYFVQSIALRHRQAEARRRAMERLALSRERLARVGEISAGVAHTVRNPLHGMFNCVDLLRQRLSPEAGVDRYLDMLWEGLSRINSVVDRLLLLTREGPLRKTEADLNELVGETLRFARVRAGDKKIRVELDLQPLPAVKIDPTRFSEALLNVLHNALDACRDGDTVTVRTYLEGTAPRTVHLDVLDTGCGIRAEHMPHIFTPFFTSKPIGQGTGLGLPITRRILEEHGGRVDVESTEGRGTRVSLVFALGSSEPEGER